MAGVDLQSATLAAGLPQWGGGNVLRLPQRCADFDSQPHPQSVDRLPAVFPLRTAFIGLGLQSCRTVPQNHGRFHLVAILASWSRPPGERELAVGQKPFGIKTGGMGMSTIVGHGAIVAYGNGRQWGPSLPAESRWRFADPVRHNRRCELWKLPSRIFAAEVAPASCVLTEIVADSSTPAVARENSPPQPLWAYVGPFVAYMVLTSIEGKGWLGLPYEAWYSLKVLVVLGLLWQFYREWPRWNTRGVGLGVALGILGVVLWLALDRLQELIPGLSALVTSIMGTREGFDPFSRQGVSLNSIAFLLVRLTGLALVVPIMEEIFWRGFLARFLIDEKFTQVPQGQFTTLSFWIVTAAFVAVHPELLAALAWGALVNWLYHKTGNIWACVAMHAVTNLLLGAWILVTGDWRLW